jgi:hypothetical protein
MKSGYIPPYALNKSVMATYVAEGRPTWKIVNLIGYEIAANEGAGRKDAQFYVEIDRETHMHRILDGQMYDASGLSLNHVGMGPWEHIPPDSNFQFWEEIVFQ